MRLFPLVLLAVTSTALAATAAPPSTASAARHYTLTPTDGALVVVVRHDPDTLMASLGHDHAIGATGWRGSVTWPATGVAGCVVDLTVPVSGLRADLAGTRTRAGLGGEGETSDHDKAKIEENLRSSRQLDADRFPTITFHATSCAPKGDQVAVAGTLTLHGVTKPVTALVKVDATDAGLRARGGFAVDGSTFGFEPFSAMGGTIKNLDRLTFVLDVSGKPTG